MTYSIKSYLIFVGSVLLTYLYLCFDVNYILNIPDYLRLLFVDAEIIEKYGQYLNYIMAISINKMIDRIESWYIPITVSFLSKTTDINRIKIIYKIYK